MNPFLVLGVPLDADDQTIRRAYLDAIKLAPPDRDPARFQVLNSAYERIKDEPSRHRHILFDHTPPGDSPVDTLVQFARLRPPSRALSFDAMKDLLRACTKT